MPTGRIGTSYAIILNLIARCIHLSAFGFEPNQGHETSHPLIGTSYAILIVSAKDS